MSTIQLPPDLEQFLREQKQLHYEPIKCEVGKVSLEWLEDLEVTSALVDLEESPLAEADPNTGKQGHYEIPCVSLLFDCQHYYPWGVLCWFPNEQQFGTVDIDHADIFMFGAEVKWSNIVSDPVRWLNYQWREKERCYFTPYPRYPFIETKNLSQQNDTDTALREARVRYELMKQKYVKRGVSGETEQLGYICAEIKAIEFTRNLPQPEVSKPAPQSAALESPQEINFSDLGAILEQALEKAESARSAAPPAQQELIDAKLKALRAQVEAFKQKNRKA